MSESVRGPGFAVLPDTPAGAAARSAVPIAAPQVVAHASGRPWLVGRWGRDQCVTAAAGPVRVAVIGVRPVTAARLARLAAQVRTPADVDRMAASLPGACHLAVSFGGQMRLQGTATGLRRVVHARLHGTTVAADRADLLAAMTRAPVDEHALAVRAACRGVLPSPLSEQTMWSGVVALPPGDCLVWDRDRVRQARWWRPPGPREPLETGARAVRTALEAATSRQPAPGERLSSDLSGGMDSTSLCFLAARHTPDLTTVRWAEAEAGNDDPAFAAHAASLLDRAEHLLVPQRQLPRIFDDPQMLADTEQPFPFTRTAARFRHLGNLLARSGSQRHLAGHGGDELFSALPGYLHQLLWRHPVTAIRHTRGYAALKRWPLSATFAGLLRPGDVAGWWRAQAEHLTAPPPPRRRPVLGWGLWPTRVTPWVTDAGVELTREALRHTADHAETWADDPGQHQALLVLRSSTSLYRSLARMFAGAGVELDLPYFDDSVVEAVLGVRLHERSTPWRYKPLLADAMRGTVPDQVLGRSTKGEYGEDLRIGFRHNLPAILDTFADSALAAHGLIDTDILRTRLLAPQADETTVFAVESLLGCETWLRAERSAAAPGRPDAATTAP
ncbi:lasso peptide isopeptide bond-forming cyclase [Streptomyces chrestomyceticus]|uniref:lasso peptide isopeptide bond-forming cyclase n=1 Tax=Streptomyces chrestomyceticus TaxID=68185 RepID=UPI0037A88148